MNRTVSGIITSRRALIAAGTLLGALLLLFFWGADRPQTVAPTDVPPVGATAWLEKNEFYEPRLKPGMRKSEVAALVPLPHNRDVEHVWMWVDSFPKGTQTNRPNWKELVGSSDGFFLVFVDDKLVTPLYSISAAGADVPGTLAGLSQGRISREEATALLSEGLKP